MTIYADVIWLFNAFVDYFLLALTALALKRKFVHIRMIFATLFASCTVFLSFTPYETLFFHPIAKIIYSIIILLIAFPFRHVTFFLKTLLMFYFIAFIVGGGLFALHFFSETSIVSRGHPAQMSTSWLFIMISLPLVFLFSKKNIQSIEWEKVKYDQLVDVEIVLGRAKYFVKGMIDSGNQLTDPLSNKPVMIMEASLLYDDYSYEVIELLLTIYDEKGGREDDPNWRFLRERAQLIPYRVIGQPLSFLCALRPDSVTIHYEGEQIITKHVLIGLEKRALSSECTFQAIVHPQLITSGLQRE